MSAVLIISIFLLAAVSLALYRTKRRSLNGAVDNDLFPPPARGLFDETQRAAAPGDAADARAKLNAATERATRLRELAGEGKFEALAEARAAGDAELYDELLSTLLGRDASAENVRAVASYVVGSDGLRANAALADALLTIWRRSPAEVPLTDLLRVAALSDDASVFRVAVEEVLEAWEQGRVPGKSAEDLRQLFDGEAWVLSSEARRTGAGFLLNRELADARRRLAAHARRQTHTAGPGEV